MKFSAAFLPFTALAFTDSLHAVAFIIDDGDAGYSTAGSWSPQGGFDASFERYNGDWQYQNVGGSGADSATYSFSSLPAGKYLVSASTAWNGQGNLTTAANYAGTDGFTTVALNQALGVRDFDRTALAGYGVGFARLGTVPVTITDGNFQLTVTNGAGANFLTADAIRLELVASDVDRVYVIDNDEGPSGGYSETGAWSAFGNENEHDNGFRYGTGTATFTFSGLAAGTYRISSSWPAGGNRDANVTATYSTVGSNGSTFLNQQITPSGDSFEEVPWQAMFTTVTVTDPSLSVTFTASGAGVVIADAVRLELISVPEPSSLCLLAAGLTATMRRRRGK